MTLFQTILMILGVVTLFAIAGMMLEITNFIAAVIVEINKARKEQKNDDDV